MTKFKVLMADSNPQMLSMMKEYFTAQENVSVFDTVTDGVSALEALHKTRSYGLAQIMIALYVRRDADNKEHGGYLFIQRLEPAEVTAEIERS